MAVGFGYVPATDWEINGAPELGSMLNVLRRVPIRDVEGYGARRSFTVRLAAVTVARSPKR